MRAAQQGSETELSPESDIGKAALHNLKLLVRRADRFRHRRKGPHLIAKSLTKKLQDGRAKPGKPYRVNAEQLEFIALFVAALDKVLFFKVARPVEAVAASGGGAYDYHP